MLAHRVKGDREMPMGTFTKFPENKAKATYCIDAQNVSTMLRGWLVTFIIRPTEYIYIMNLYKFAASLINPYKPSVLFVGHRQTMQNQNRRRRTRHLIKFSTIC